MSFMKNFGISLGIFFLLNAIFLFVYAAVGGVGGATIGEFFTLIGGDLWGFFTALLSVGGTQADVFTSMMYHVNMGANPYPVLTNIIGILWVLVPGLVTALITFNGTANNIYIDSSTWYFTNYCNWSNNSSKYVSYTIPPYNFSRSFQWSVFRWNSSNVFN